MICERKTSSTTTRTLFHFLTLTLFTSSSFTKTRLILTSFYQDQFWPICPVPPEPVLLKPILLGQGLPGPVLPETVLSRPVPGAKRFLIKTSYTGNRLTTWAIFNRTSFIKTSFVHFGELNSHRSWSANRPSSRSDLQSVTERLLFLLTGRPWTWASPPADLRTSRHGWSRRRQGR